ncbi:MAG: 1,4-dihydroxy-2-naphthoate octaprenyltransferase [Actinobacteria bacterium]|nr:MAG: 1,4-dihydroxy-2-naphthoate octaprenyltransferase [Actinomycetota bacterium]
MSVTVGDWIEGARLRTLPAAIAPVVVGTAAAVKLGAIEPFRVILALSVAIFLQIGVNFANDYSDGIRGTDDHRVGPPRLTGAGKVSPQTVRNVAFACFAVAGVAGLVLVVLSGTWFFIALGALAIAAAWFYTGGRSPYGYMGIGLSEFLVFVFFGLLATVGTTYTQVFLAPWWVWLSAASLGLISVALLMVNNIRDISTDRESGKTTLPVRLGAFPSRVIYMATVLLPALGMVIVFAWLPASCTVCLVPTILFSAYLSQKMTQATTREEFLALLRDTGLYSLVWSAMFVMAVV